MPRHIIASGDQTISGNLTVSGNLFADNVVYTGSTGSFTGSFYPLTTNPSGYITTGQTGAFAPVSHAHGNITNAGAIGSTANLPIITTTAGALTVGAFGTGATNFCSGNDPRLSDARVPTDGSVTPAKLSGNAPTWNGLGSCSMTGSDINPTFSVYNTDSTSIRYPAFSAGGYGNASHGIVYLYGANGTVGSPSETLYSNVLGQLLFLGYNGSGFRQSAKINAVAAENFTSSGEGAALVFSTTANGEISHAERMRISQNGNLLIGTTSDVSSSILTVTSTTKGIRLPLISDKANVVTPAEGLMIYDTVENAVFAHNGSAWKEMVDLDTAQSITNKTIALNLSTGLPTAGLVNDAVTFAKMQNSAAGSSLLGKPSAGAGDFSEITLDSTLAFSGTTLRRAAIVGNITIAEGSNAATIATGVISPNHLTDSPLSWGIGSVSVYEEDYSSTFHIFTDNHTTGRYPFLYMSSYNSGYAGYPVFIQRTARGTSSSPANVSGGDYLSSIRSNGYGSGIFRNTSEIYAVAAQTFTNSFGTTLRFATISNGATSQTEKMRITENGSLSIGGVTDHVSANLTLGGTDKALKLNVVTGVAAITTPVNGMIFYNSTTHKLNFYGSGAWRVVTNT